MEFYCYHFTMTPISYVKLKLIFKLILLLVYVAKVTCANGPFNRLQQFGNGVVNSIGERIPKLTVKGLFGEISLQNLDDYAAGVKTGDKDLNITQLIQKYGYPVETHEVETEDGYILTVFRIPSKNNGTVVLLEHGIVLSAADWVTTGPNISLAYLLADKGYDVWLGNTRGNDYCRKHVNMTIDDNEFWDFSWDEIGRYDLPAIIDYILKVTGKEQLMFIGHSQGTTAFFVMASERPEYNKKVSFAVMLAVVTWTSHMTSPPFQILSFVGQDYNFINIFIGEGTFANGTIQSTLLRIVCDNSVIQNLFCLNLAYLFVGFDNSLIDYKVLPTILGHAPSGISSKQLAHYGQTIRSGKFRRYDYGLWNFEKYGFDTPPDYPVELITVPMAIFQGKSDWISLNGDIETLLSHMNTEVTFRVVQYESFAHLDFMYAKNARKLVYNDVIDLMKRHEN